MMSFWLEPVIVSFALVLVMRRWPVLFQNWKVQPAAEKLLAFSTENRVCGWTTIPKHLEIRCEMAGGELARVEEGRAVNREAEGEAFDMAERAGPEVDRSTRDDEQIGPARASIIDGFRR
jgi:hypothetical protein